MIKKILYLLPLLLICFAYLSIFQVNEGELCVLRPALGHSKISEMPRLYAVGWHLKWPIYELVDRFDTRTQLLRLPNLSLSTKDAEIFDINLLVHWQIEDVSVFLKTIGSLEAAEEKVAEVSAKAVEEQASTLTLLNALEGGKILSLLDASLLSANFALASQGILISNISPLQVHLSKSSTEKMKQILTAAIQEKANAQLLDQQLKADEIMKTATVDADLKFTQAQADADRLLLEAQSIANNLYQTAYLQDPEFYEFYRKIQLYHQLAAAHGTVVISSQGKLLGLPKFRE